MSPRRSPGSVTASTTFHRALQRATRLFGGQYGRLPASLLAPREQSIDTGEVTLRLLAWAGAGTPLVLLHGLNNNAWSWARVAGQLAPERAVFAISQRGHGGSTSPDHGYLLRDTSRDLIAVIDSLGLERVHLGGHSWGGKVAVHFAVEHADRIASITLADPALPQGLNGLIRAFPALSNAALRAERGPFPSVAAWETAGRSITYLQHWDELDRRLWKEGFDIMPDGSVRHRLPESGYQEILLEAIAEDLTPLLAKIRCPVLLMRPTFTLSFLPGELRTLRRNLVRLREKYVPGDHTFIHTNPCDTALQVRSFLSAADSDRQSGV